MVEFNDQFFEKRLLNLKETQDSITGLSAWCLQHRESHKAIVGTWLKVLKKVKIEQRLTLFYLANDVIQYSKRKSLQFVESWGTALQKATTLVRDDKVKGKILRLFKIWNERSIYDEVFLSDLCGLLTTTTKKNASAENTEFQPNVMFDKMKNMELLEDNTNEELTFISENPLNLNDIKSLSSIVKERRTSGLDVDSELEDSICHLKKYMLCLKQEVAERTSLLELLEQGEAFYESQKKEAKVVSNAYKNFGSRVKTMKRKLDELVTSLPSPIPSPDINAPSPSPLDDIELPGEDNTTEYAYNPTSLNTTAQYAQYNTSNNTSTLDTSASSDFYTPTPTSTSNSQNDSSYQPEYTPTSFTGGFSSFIGSTSLPFDIQKSLFSSDQDNAAVVTSSETNTVDNYEGNKIEVIGSTNPPPGSTPTIVPPPSAPHSDMSTPAQTSLASILNMLKQPPPTTTPVVQYTPTQSIPTPGTQQYTPTPSIPTPGDQHYNPVQGIPTPTGQQYNPVQSIPTPGSQQYTPIPSIPPPSNQQYTPVQSIPTPGNQQYTPVQSIPTPGSQQYTPVQSIPTPVNTQYPPPTPQSPDPLPLPPPPLPPSMFDLDEEFKPPPWLLNTETANTGSDYHPAPTPQVYTSPPPLPTRAPAYTSPPPGNIPIPPPRTNGINPLPAKFPTWDTMLSDSPASPPPPPQQQHPPPVFDPREPPPLPPLPIHHATSNEYEDANSVDVDDRSLPVISRLRKDTDHRHNMSDMDHRASQHRNLISLTGSPKIDTDYRSVPSRSNSQDHSDSNANGKTTDNTESVDMDLSDDDEAAAAKAQFKGSFNINTQTGSEAEAAPSPLPSTESETVPAAMLDMILQDPTAEKLLSSINIETLSGISALTGKVPEPSVSPDLAPTPVPSTTTPETPRPKVQTQASFRGRIPKERGPHGAPVCTISPTASPDGSGWIPAQMNWPNGVQDKK
ncbi:hypothetical protein M8J75_013463 [Diaphorina citri]|nr:hypothetical protein M8J75_013463 [Diaphorina citri]